MPLFAEFWSLVSHLPKNPLDHLVFVIWLLRPEPAGFFGQIHHDGTRLKDGKRGATTQRLVIDDRWHAALALDPEKRRRQLIPAAAVARPHWVRHATFLQQHTN